MAQTSTLNTTRRTNKAQIDISFPDASHICTSTWAHTRTRNTSLDPSSHHFSPDMDSDLCPCVWTCAGAYAFERPHVHLEDGPLFSYGHSHARM
ncbi:unnamed protein product [Fusarium graminearum]|uniref:Chromosome 4, complete genome n=1 Tax=Gibberella zeae (strain ATCC MYA-4620 / CBS 123657 / FGSC 9075 / NRRL 31084 / PH-1) TaxID=229533 RepID=A0A098DVJ0_GIBZE|nr:unnamed protein product [Fusarium graminearum]CZS72605.1 unnamed protein product [Fusarium graminearum]